MSKPRAIKPPMVLMGACASLVPRKKGGITLLSLGSPEIEKNKTRLRMARVAGKVRAAERKVLRNVEAVLF